MSHGGFELAGVSRLLALLVDRRRDAFPDLRGRFGVFGRRQAAKTVVGRFGLGKIAQIELRMRDHGPCGAGQRRLDGRLLGDDRLADGDREVELVLGKEVLGHRREHGAGLGMLGIGVREAQTAVEVPLMPCRLLRTLERVFVLAIRQQRRIARLRGLFVHRVGVRGAFVLRLRLRVILAFEQDFHPPAPRRDSTGPGR